MVSQDQRRELRVQRREVRLPQDLVAIDDRLDRALLALMETVARLLLAVEPMRQQAPRRRGDSRPALLAPARNFVPERRRQRQLGDVLDLPLKVLDSRRSRYGRTLRSANQPV